MSDVQIKGLAELQRALDELPAKIEKNIMRGALRAGAKVIRDEAIVLAPKLSERMANSIRHGTKMSGSQVQAYVRAGKHRANDYDHGYYARFVEFGTKAHIIRARRGKALAIGVSKVDHPGSRPHPFIRPALDNKGQAAVEAMREYIRTRLLTKHGIDVPAPLEEGDE